MKTRLIAPAALLLLAAFTSVSQETPSTSRLTNDHYFDFERVSNAQISPDGAHIVYTRQQANKIEDRWDSSLWIMNADGSQHRFLTKGSDPRWSSDGKRILYIAEGEPRGPQIFIRWIDADGPATQVTHATDKVADARWSPDGKSIAFSMFVPEKDTWNISMPPAPSPDLLRAVAVAQTRRGGDSLCRGHNAPGASREPLSELWRSSSQKWGVNRQSWLGQAMSSTVANPELVGRSQLPSFMRQPPRKGRLSPRRQFVRHSDAAGGRACRVKRDRWSVCAKARPSGRSQAVAAPPGRVSESLTNEVRCGDAKGSLPGRGCEGCDLGAASGGGERG